MTSPEPDQAPGQEDLSRGLPMIAKWDPYVLAQEKEELAELATKPFLTRIKGYWAKVGPGWLQSALTLGGGSAAASLFLGAYLGYAMLWLQPAAMLLGIIMLAAMAYQTLATNVRPFDALRLHIHPVVAWAWALASLAATIIWHFPQYGLAGGMAQDMIQAITKERLGHHHLTPMVVGIVILVVSIWITWNYGKSSKGIRVYERAIKYMVWLIVIAFALVVVRQSQLGKVEWGKIAKGFVWFRVPRADDPLGPIDLGFARQFAFRHLAVQKKYAAPGQVTQCLAAIRFAELYEAPALREYLIGQEFAGADDADEWIDFFREARQAGEKISLAETMVRKGYVSRKQADELLAMGRRVDECIEIVRKKAESGEKATLSQTMVRKGYVPRIRADEMLAELKGRTAYVFMAAFGAAVGINMTFLFGYSLLARGWGREHHGLARFDLLSGMFVPYAIATSLMIIATASTIYGTPDVPAKGTGMGAVEAAQVLQGAVGPIFARIIFGLGILGMALSTITLHMLVSAFIVCEIFGWEPTGWRYKVGSLIPAVGVLGTVFWGTMRIWIAIPTSAVCGLMLPIAYISFFVLNNKRSFLGEHKPTGARAALWNVGMLLAIAASVAFAGYWTHANWAGICGYANRIIGLFWG